MKIVAFNGTMAPVSSESIPGDAAGSFSPDSVGLPKRRAAVPQFDKAQAERFIEEKTAAEGGELRTELRLPSAQFAPGRWIEPNERFSSTLAGWYDNKDDLLADLGRLRGVSPYVTVNPPLKDVMLRSRNKLIRSKSTTNDKEISVVHWLFIDIDAVRPSGISSTEGELAAVEAVINQILADHPEIADAAIWGCSGNGYWLLIKVKPLSPADSPALASKAIAYFKGRYDIPGKVEIDPATRNTARIMPMSGCAKCKGEHSNERQWRLATIDSPPGRSLQPIALPDWVATHPAPESPATGQGKPSPSKAKKAPGPVLKGADVTIRAVAYLDKMAPAVSGQGGHNQTFDAAAALVKGFGLTIEAAFPLLQNWNARCQPPWADHELRHKLKDAEKRTGDVGYLLNARPLPGDGSPLPSSGDRNSHPSQAGGDEDTRPAIEVTVEHHLVLEAAVGVLAADSEVFARGDVLVRVPLADAAKAILVDDDPYSAGRLVKAIRVEESIVSSLLSRNATFYRMRQAKDDEPYPVDEAPPRFLSAAIPGLGSWPGMRHLAGITYAPYVRRDGSVVDAPGYDPETEYVYHATCEIAPGTKNPTRDDAMEAAGAILHLVSQFPFAEPDIDGAVWLAMLLTMIQRPAIRGPVPGFVFSGNNAGAGKGLLVDTAGIIAMGKNLQASTYTDDPAEMRKLLFSIALSGCAAVHFDNVENGSTYGCAPLDSAMTAAEIADRILGQSRTASAPFRPVCVLTGNNVLPTADAYRRWAIARLVTNEERPFCRDDIRIKDLRAYALANRPELLRDALTILRAHAQAGRPGGNWAPLGSFGVWDTHIRGAVYFATENDPISTMLETAEARPERVNLARLIDAWEKRGPKLTVSEAIKAAFYDDDLSDILTELSGGKTPLNSRSIGRYLAKHRNVVVDGRKLVEDGTKHKVVRWAVEKVGSSYQS